MVMSTQKKTSMRMPVRQMGVGKDLTMGQIAKLCGVSPRTASKWVDSKALTGYRLAGSVDRRVTRESLVSFLRAEGMGHLVPREWTRSFLLVNLPPRVQNAITLAVCESGFRVQAYNGIAALGLVAVLWPEVVVVGLGFGRAEIAAIRPSVVAGGLERKTFVVGVSSADDGIDLDRVPDEYGVDAAATEGQLLDDDFAKVSVNLWVSLAADLRAAH